MEDKLTEFEAIADQSDNEPDSITLMCYTAFWFLISCAFWILIYELF